MCDGLTAAAPWRFVGTINFFRFFFQIVRRIGGLGRLLGWIAGRTRTDQTDEIDTLMTGLSDFDLMVRFQEGDLDAFGELVRRWEHSLLRIAARVIGDVDEAEDVRQAVFLRLAQSP